jgi:EAL domain-containing protein (putative c-di-GMP-specific phosphodiesterase class I)
MISAGPVRIGASVGTALSDDGASVTGLLADADIRMYDAKSERRGLATRPFHDRSRSAEERRQLADDLAHGISNGEVVAYLQPVIELATGRLVGLEALARWHHPAFGLLLPAAFMDLADDAGLDVLLGDAVMESACRTMAAVRQVFPDVQLAVNMSVGQLADPHLTQRMRAQLARHRMDLSALVVEITERSTLARRAAAGAASPEATLYDLHAAGASLSLDDFGTGFSSLTHVRRYPLSALKIDQSFVSSMVSHAEDRAVVAAVIGLAKALELRVVGEGVETAEQLAMLTDLGCDDAQGFLVARPMEASTVLAWAQAQAGRSTTSPDASAGAPSAVRTSTLTA